MKNKSCKCISMSKKGSCSTFWSFVCPRWGAYIRPRPQVPEASSYHWARWSRHSCNLFGLQPPDPSSPGSGEIRCNSWRLAAKHRFDRAAPQREQQAGADSPSGGRMRCIIPRLFFSFPYFKTYCNPVDSIIHSDLSWFELHKGASNICLSLGIIPKR